MSMIAADDESPRVRYARDGLRRAREHQARSARVSAELVSDAEVELAAALAEESGRSDQS